MLSEPSGEFLVDQRAWLGNFYRARARHHRAVIPRKRKDTLGEGSKTQLAKHLSNRCSVDVSTMKIVGCDGEIHRGHQGVELPISNGTVFLVSKVLSHYTADFFGVL